MLPQDVRQNSSIPIMKIENILRNLSLGLIVAAGFVAGTANLSAAMAAGPKPLSAADTQFLAQYEAVRASLAADDLAGAKAAAAKIDGHKVAAAIAEAKTLDQARQAFEHLSMVAVKMVQGQSGYFVAHCPMYRVDGKWAHWVQTNETISNPYMGKMSPTCGSIMKDE